MKNTFNILLFLLAGTLVSDNCEAFHNRFGISGRAASRNTQNMREMNQNKQNEMSKIGYSQSKSVSEKKEEQEETIIENRKLTVQGQVSGGTNEELNDEVTNEKDVKKSNEITTNTVEHDDSVELIQDNSENTSDSSFKEKETVTPDERITLRLYGNVNQQSVELTYAQVKTLLEIYDEKSNKSKKGKRGRVKNLNYSAVDLNEILDEKDLFKPFGKSGNGAYQISGDALKGALDKFNKDE